MVKHTILWLDLETRSDVNLLFSGLRKYVIDPSSKIICISYAFDDLPVQTWFPEDNPEVPQDLSDYLNNTDGVIYAHNAAFERAVFDYIICNDFNIKPIRIHRWRCSMARAQAHGLPPSLALLGHCLMINIRKMDEGTRLIRDYSITTGGKPNPWKNNDKNLMRDYCEKDVASMRQICSVLRELSDEEWRQYTFNELINDRGVPVDTALAKAAVKYSESVKNNASDNIRRITDGKVINASVRTSRDAWLRDNLPPICIDLITKKGTNTIYFDKSRRKALKEHSNTPSNVKEFIDALEAAGGSTTAKYHRIVQTEVDGRVHGVLQWNGAGATGRYSSRGIQLQNMRRDTIDDPEEIITKIKQGEKIDNPADTLGRLIRSVITHKDGVTYSDYSQIEARVLPWLADTPSANSTLDIFRNGKDLYEENARLMFPTLMKNEANFKSLRQAAKVAVLACGFGGGKGAILAMATMYGLTYSETEAEDIKVKWRSSNNWAVTFWNELNAAVKAAVKNPVTCQRAGRVTLYYDGLFWLWLKLPSGRFIAYANPKVEWVITPWGESVEAVTAIWGAGRPKVGEKWPRRTLNHIVLCENATQGTAADIMRETVVRAEDSDIPVLFTVHDEIIVEGRHEEELHKVMTEAPTWALGLPIDAVTTYSKRYGK